MYEIQIEHVVTYTYLPNGWEAGSHWGVGQGRTEREQGVQSLNRGEQG